MKNIRVFNISSPSEILKNSLGNFCLHSAADVYQKKNAEQSSRATVSAAIHPSLQPPAGIAIAKSIKNIRFFNLFH